MAKDFLRANQAAFALTGTEIENLDLTVRDVTDRAVFLQFDQTVDGIRVFRGHVKISLNRAGQVVQAGMADVVPGVSVTTKPRLNAREAVQFAFKTLGLEPPAEMMALTPTQQGKIFFANPLGGQYNPIRVELSVFPMTASSARLAYRLYLESGGSGSYEILIDAQDGRLLFRRNLTRFLAQGRVWKQSPIHGDRELVDFADGWLPQSGVVTTGNNADAYVDTNMEPLPDIRNGRAFSAGQVFDFPVSEDTTGRDFGEFKAAAVTNLFYFVNTAHDYFYDLGFTESAGNFQTDNFGRGGKGNDAVRAQAKVQFENASILVYRDGIPPLIEMGFRLGFKDGLKRFDLSYAGDVVMHEYAHGLTFWIVGGPDDVTCLSGTQSGAMGEGWSDYFGISFFDTPVYDEYSSENSVRGQRRQGYEGYTFTYEDLGNERFEVHDDGEIWAATLWDLRKELGQEVTDQLVVDGVKFTPCGPSMIDARDGILMADQTTNGAANRAKIWEVFARHGMGNSAGGIDGSSLLKDTVYTAAFDLPPDLQPGNRSPTITSQPPVVVPRLGDAYVYDMGAADPDGDPLTYELTEAPEGMTIDRSTGQIQWTATFSSQRIKVTVSDGNGGRVIHGFRIPVETFLTPGVPVTIAAPKNTAGQAIVEVPEGTPVLQVTLRGGSGDPNLRLDDPDGMLYGDSFRPGTAETLSVSAPKPGRWVVSVRTGREPYSGVSLEASFPVPVTLPEDGVLSNRSGDLSSETFYHFAVPPGAFLVQVSLRGGSGGPTLLLNRNTVPVCQLGVRFPPVDQPCIFSGRRSSLGLIEIINPEPGDWFIDLSAGVGAYSGKTLAVSITVTPEPHIYQGGVADAASFRSTLAPGGIAYLFGSSLANTTLSASDLPLPRELAGVQVMIDGVNAPLFSISPTQINFQVPFEAPSAGTVEITVYRDGVPSPPLMSPVAEFAPGIFTYQRGPGTSDPIILHADFELVTQDRPAEPGEVLIILATGVGGLTNRPATGAAAPESPLARTTVAPAIMVGGPPAEVLFAGLVPSLVGLAQFNIRLSTDLPPGGRLPLTIEFAGSSSQTVDLAVRSSIPGDLDIAVQLDDVFPKTAISTDRLTAFFTVSNPTGYHGLITRSLYISTEPVISLDTGQLINTSSILLAGADREFKTGENPLPEGLAPGVYYLGVAIDMPGDTITSATMSNAIDINIVEERPPFDLSVEIGTATPVTVAPGDPIVVTYTASAPEQLSGTFQGHLYLSSDSSITTDDRLITSTTFDMLGGSAVVTTTRSWMPFKSPGNYFVGVILETEGDIDPANNVSEGLPIVVTDQRIPFDLGVQLHGVSPAAAEPGQYLTLTATARNLAGSRGAYRLRVYLSTDETISSTDRRLTSRSVEFFGQDRELLLERIWVPSNIPPGNYFIGAIIETSSDTNPLDNVSNVLPLTVGP